MKTKNILILCVSASMLVNVGCDNIALTIDSATSSKDRVNPELFSPLRRVIKQVESEFSTGTSSNEFKSLIKQLSTELSMLGDKKLNGKEREIFSVYEDVLVCFKDADTLLVLKEIAPMKGKKYNPVDYSIGDKQYYSFVALGVLYRAGIPVYDFVDERNLEPIVQKYSLHAEIPKSFSNYRGLLDSVNWNCNAIPHDSYKVPLKRGLEQAEKAHNLTR